MSFIWDIKKACHYAVVAVLVVIAVITIGTIAMSIGGCDAVSGLRQRDDALKATEARLTIRMYATEQALAENARALSSATGENKARLLVVQADLNEKDLDDKELQAVVAATRESIAKMQSDIEKADEKAIEDAKSLISTLPPNIALPAGLLFTTLVGFWRSYQARQNNKRMVLQQDSTLTPEQKVTLSGKYDPSVNAAIAYAKGKGKGLPI